MGYSNKLMLASSRRERGLLQANKIREGFTVEVMVHPDEYPETGPIKYPTITGVVEKIEAAPGNSIRFTIAGQEKTSTLYAQIELVKVLDPDVTHWGLEHWGIHHGWR